ncbi:MAG: response regulator transcription factor [Chloroflexi bacterium]|nr:response regulator transcription factor [Chloroflexota bacterium]
MATARFARSNIELNEPVPFRADVLRLKREAGHIGVNRLSARESEVLALVAEGSSNKVVAARLKISERTVKNHLTNIMAKLQATDRTHAVVTAVRLGWLVL